MRSRSLIATFLVSAALALVPAQATAARILASSTGKKYEVVRLAGKGGFGHVYKAWELTADKSGELVRRSPVALKTYDSLASAINEDEPLKAIAGLRNLPRTLGNGFDEKQQKSFVVTRWVEGKTLDAWRKSQPRDNAQVIEAVRKAALIVSTLNARGWLHLDLKPKNIMIDARGIVNVIDIGTAQLKGEGGTTVATGAGTRALMPPEQRAASTVDDRADVYALAGTLLRLLDKRTVIEPALDAVIKKGHAVKPADRYATTRDFANALGVLHARR